MIKFRSLHLGVAVTGLALAGLLLPEAVAYSGLADYASVDDAASAA